MRALLIFILLAACSPEAPRPVAADPTFVCSADGWGADVRVVAGRTYVHPVGWRCDYAEWQRTGRINVRATAAPASRQD
jgi:hypothetical protein